MFLTEFGVAVAALSILALTGGFALLPFSGPYILLAAPLAGIAVHAVGVSVLYGVVKLPFIAAAGITLAAGSLLTIAVFVLTRRSVPIVTAAVASLSTALVSVLLCTAAALSLGSAAITFTDGTDHAGYAHVADWLIAHPVTEQPVASPELLYQNTPAHTFRADPRLGSMTFLASVAILRGTSALFAYDSACAIALTAGILAVAGVFARRPSTLALLLVGLLVSHWFDYSRGGFFGKLLSYPSILMLVGLFISGVRDQLAMAALLLLAIGVAAFHSGLAAALLFGGLVGAYLLARVWTEKEWRAALPQGAVLVSTGLALVATTGLITRPLNMRYPDWNVGWRYAMPRLADLENQGTRLSGLPTDLAIGFAVVSAAFALALLILALRRRHAATIGLVAGEAALLAGLAICDADAAAFQLIGTFYPITLCAAVHLADTLGSDIGGRRLATVVLAAAVAFVGMRVPRMVGSIDRYVIDASPSARYSSAEMENTVRTIGDATVLVDVGTPQPALVFLVELGRRDMAVQWSEKSWRLLFRGMSQPPPASGEAPVFVLGEGNGAPYALTRR